MRTGQRPEEEGERGDGGGGGGEEEWDAVVLWRDIKEREGDEEEQDEAEEIGRFHVRRDGEGVLHEVY